MQWSARVSVSAPAFMLILRRVGDLALHTPRMVSMCRSNTFSRYQGASRLTCCTKHSSLIWLQASNAMPVKNEDVQLPI
jgi:hypothetical protein